MLDTEDLAESENKELASRLESLESIVRMLELKHKNSLEHASRLEEREGDLKKVRTDHRWSNWIRLMDDYENLLTGLINRNMPNFMNVIPSYSKRMSIIWSEPNFSWAQHILSWIRAIQNA